METKFKKIIGVSILAVAGFGLFGYSLLKNGVNPRFSSAGRQVTVRQGYVDTFTVDRVSGWFYDSAGNGTTVELVYENIVNPNISFRQQVRNTIYDNGAVQWLKINYRITVTKPVGFAANPLDVITSAGMYRIASATFSGSGVSIPLSAQAATTIQVGSGVAEAPTGTVPISVPTPSGAATLADFWNGSARFQYVRQWRFPSEDNPAKGLVFANSQAHIVPVGTTWYRFSREYIDPRPSKCAHDYARTVVYRSTDNGATWTNRTVVVEPTTGTPWECAALDAGAYYDESTTTWHVLYQCLNKQSVWAVCYASRKNTSPLGAFQVAAQPAVEDGDIFRGLMGMSAYGQEGTPQILEKVNNRYLVSFHGYDGTKGVRAAVWTTDFQTWQAAAAQPMLTAAQCSGWNVAWGSGGCIGFGLAATVREGAYYYTLAEASNQNLGCLPNQQWAFGLLRSATLTSPQWESLPNGPAILVGSQQKDPTNKTTACAVSYAQIFQSGGDTYLTFFLIGNADGFLDEPLTGRYLYKLEKNGPVAAYSFRSGSPRRVFTPSDVVGVGDLEASAQNVQWNNPGVVFNGTTSLLTLPRNAVANLPSTWTLQLVMRLTGGVANSAETSFIGGDRSAAWLELYKDRTLCAWAETATGPKPICTEAPLRLQTDYDIRLSVAGGVLQLNVNGAKRTVSVGAVPAVRTLTIGSSGANAQGYYSSWSGLLKYVALHPSLQD